RPHRAGRDAARVRAQRRRRSRPRLPSRADAPRLTLGDAVGDAGRGRAPPRAGPAGAARPAARPVRRGSRSLPAGRGAQGRLHAMRALRWHGPGDVRVEEVDDPVPATGEVLVRVEVALTDGTDLKAFRRGHPLLLDDPPAPFGHEFCGLMEDGRRVVAANSDGDRADLQLLNGAYAEWLVVPERIARINLL